MRVRSIQSILLLWTYFAFEAVVSFAPICSRSSMSSLGKIKMQISSVDRSEKVNDCSLKICIETLISGKDLTAKETEDAWAQMLDGDVSPERVAGLLCLLRAKGETPKEIAGCVRGMKRSCIPVNVEKPLLDIVGTGGDGADTINISTASAVLAAAAGARVCKFGNRSVSSLCGSADVLEALGINVELSPEEVEKCCKEANIAFMYAPKHFPAMKNVAPIRKALGIRTTFNILGPLTNPAESDRVVIGVFHEELMPLVSGALCETGHIEVGLVVHGCGLDEVSPLGPSRITEIRNMSPSGEPKKFEVNDYVLDPLDYGIPRCTIEELRGGNREENARLFLETLEGGNSSNAKRDAIVLNAGLGLYVYGLAPSIKEAFQLARSTLNSGKALEKLHEWIKISQEISID